MVMPFVTKKKDFENKNVIIPLLFKHCDSRCEISVGQGHLR